MSRVQNARLLSIKDPSEQEWRWYWHKNRNIDQLIRIENPEINPRTYAHLIYDKGGKNIQWRKNSLFNKWCWESWTAMCKRMKVENFLTLYTKIKSKCIKYLNVRPEYRVLRDKHRQYTFLHKSIKILFDPTPILIEIKTKLNKWDLIKLKCFCKAKETINKI